MLSKFDQFHETHGTSALPAFNSRSIGDEDDEACDGETFSGGDRLLAVGVEPDAAGHFQRGPQRGKALSRPKDEALVCNGENHAISPASELDGTDVHSR